MKKYPADELILEDGTVCTIPTNQAIQEFESYLDEQEKAFLKKMLPTHKMMIAISVNPFNAFKGFYQPQLEKK
jgi:hypothetical protein